MVFEINEANARTSWKYDQVPKTPGNDSLNNAIAMKFANQGEGEHASIASFARHTLQLMTMGAPPTLLMGSQKASLDEIKHARMCYSVAEAFLGKNVQPNDLEIDGGIKALSRQDVIKSVINEGCIGETIAAVQAQLGSQYVRQPMVKNILEKIASDESNHAQLAWTTVQWARNRFPDLRDIIEETFRASLDQPIKKIEKLPKQFCNDCKNEEVLREHGLLLDVDHHITQNLGIQKVIEPAVLNDFRNVELISNEILKMDFSKY